MCQEIDVRQVNKGPLITEKWLEQARSVVLLEREEGTVKGESRGAVEQTRLQRLFGEELGRYHRQPKRRIREEKVGSPFGSYPCEEISHEKEGAISNQFSGFVLGNRVQDRWTTGEL